MFINLQPNVLSRQGYSFAIYFGRSQHPCCYFIFAIRTLQDYSVNSRRHGKKSESQMGFFSEYTCLLEFTQYHVVVISLLVYPLRRLVGRILICLNVTA